MGYQNHTYIPCFDYENNSKESMCDLNKDFDCEDFPDWMYDWFINVWANQPIPEVIDLTIDDPDEDLNNSISIELQEKEEENNRWVSFFHQVSSSETLSYFKSVDHLIPDDEVEMEDQIEIIIKESRYR